MDVNDGWETARVDGGADDDDGGGWGRPGARVLARRRGAGAEAGGAETRDRGVGEDAERSGVYCVAVRISSDDARVVWEGGGVGIARD